MPLELEKLIKAVVVFYMKERRQIKVQQELEHPHYETKYSSY